MLKKNSFPFLEQKETGSIHKFCVRFYHLFYFMPLLED